MVQTDAEVGAGVPRAIADCRTLGVAEPTVKINGKIVIVTIFPRPPEVVSGGSFSGPVVQGRDFTNTTFVSQQAAAAPVALAQLPRWRPGSPGGRRSWRRSPGCWTRRRARVRWWCRRWRGWPGWARRRWRCMPRMPPGHRAGSRAGCCSSTCTVTTRARCSRARRWTRCCGRWGSRVSTSRTGPSSARGCTGRRWRRSLTRCWLSRTMPQPRRRCGC